MKTLINFAAITILIMFSAACTDETETPTSKNPAEKAQIGGVGIKIGLKCTIARAIEIRPRDGETCDCVYCFGFCDCISLGIGYPTFSRVLDDAEWNPGEELPSLLDVSRNGDIILYIESRVYWSESEFGIDQALSFDSDNYPDLPVRSLSIDQGVYSFKERSGQIEYAPNEFYNYQGYIILSGTVVF